MNRYADKYIILTGGAGFIGSAVLKILNERGYQNIVIVDELGTDDKWKNLVGKDYDELVAPLDLFDWLEERESEVGAIIHLGACSSTVETDADYLYENNTHYSQLLAEYAIDHDVRFIYASSAATYGAGERGFEDSESDLESLRPLNMYGYSKHLFDLWVKKMGLLDRVTGLKYFNVFGPNEYHKGRMSSAICHFVNQIQESGMVKLFRSSEPERYEDGGQLRDFIYVKDAARITCDLLENEITGIYNVGTGSSNSWNRLAENVFKGLDKPAKIEYIEMPKDLVGKYQNFTEAKMDRLTEAFGTLEFTPFDTAVVEYVEDYLKDRNYW